MSTDKNVLSADSPDSASSLPLQSPSTEKDPNRLANFSAAIASFPSCELLDTEPMENCSSLQLMANQTYSCREQKQQESRECERSHSKEEKGSKWGSSLDCVPILEREKVTAAQEAFEVPELTAESIVSSEQIDVDSESNTNDLPLCSTRRYKIEKVFHEQSEGSDECEERTKAYLAKQNYAQSKGSDRSESDDFPSICKLCYALVQKTKMQELENADLLKEAQAAKEELVKLQEKNRRLIEQREEQMHVETLPPHLLKDHFLAQIQLASRTVIKVNEHLASYSFDFRGKEVEALQRFSLEFKKLECEVLERVQRESKRKEIQQLHNGYKKIITRLIKEFEERQVKKEADFRRFMGTLVRKPFIETARALEGKAERCRRKSKTYAEKEDNTDMDLLESSRQWQQVRQQQEELLALIKEKEGWKEQERAYLQRGHRLQAQLLELSNERNIYRSRAGQYSQQFTNFMKRLSHNKSSIFLQSDFFRTISQRVFEISNCIPFQENDEQNLFAPQNQDELFEMLDRICRFYRRIEDYNLQRESQFQAEKSSFMRFLKELVEQCRVPPRLLLQTLQGNSYTGLGYLKELIRSSKLPQKTAIPERQSIGNRILKIQKTKSLTISENGIQDD